MNRLSEQQSTLNAQWQQEKGAIDELSNLKEEIERVQLQVEQAKRNYDLNKAAELEYGTLAGLQKQLSDQEAALAAADDGGQDKSLLREEVTEDDIAEVIAKWTGIPVAKLVQSEMEKLLSLESQLHERVVGQQQAVTAVADAIQRSRAGLVIQTDHFLFLGPGVAKAELSKPWRRSCSADDAMARIDMSRHGEAQRQPSDRCSSGLRDYKPADALKPSVVAPTPSSCSTRWKRHPMCST